MNITENNIIGTLVAQDYRTASVFKSYSIDFCCKGNRTIKDVCTNQNINADHLVKELEKATQKTDAEEVDYNKLPLDELADWIEKKHHHYVKTKIQEIVPYLAKVAKVHGARHPELLKIQELFEAAATELTKHLHKEEMILFPSIRKVVKALNKNERVPFLPFGTLANPISMMKEEHELEGDRFEEIAKLSDNFTPPADACNTYQVAFALLKEFQEDLHLHIHLENNILFPKAMLLA